MDFEGGSDFREAVKTDKAEIITAGIYKGKVTSGGLNDFAKPQLDNYVDCIRAGNQNTNGNVHKGFWHSAGAIMAKRSYREGSKLYWDRKREESVEHPVLD